MTNAPRRTAAAACDKRRIFIVVSKLYSSNISEAKSLRRFMSFAHRRKRNRSNFMARDNNNTPDIINFLIELLR